MVCWNGDGCRKYTPGGNLSKPKKKTKKNYVVDGATPLLGRDLQRALGISVVCGSTVCAVDQEADSALPAITGFVQRVKVKPEVQPVQQHLRPLPYALREEVKKHLLNQRARAS